MKEDQKRVRTLLTDTITLLCKNGLTYKKNMKVQGLLGITLDDEDVFIVHVNECMGGLAIPSSTGTDDRLKESDDRVHERRSPTKRRRRRSAEMYESSPSQTIDLDPDVEIKTEPETILLDEIKIQDDPGITANPTDDGLSFALSSIEPTLPSASVPGDTIGGPPPVKRRASNDIMTSFSNTNTTTSQPFITGIVPNLAADGSQSSNSSYTWDNNTSLDQSGMANWTSPNTSHTVSQNQPRTSMQQGFSPPAGGSRGGTVRFKFFFVKLGVTGAAIYQNPLYVSDRH